MSLFTSRKKAAENVAGPAEPLVRTPTQQAWIRFRKNQLAMAGAEIGRAHV